MADINDRLERLNKREQLARRAHQPTVAAPVEGLGEDFAEVLDAAARAVLRHPGLSVMVAPADGRLGRTVVRLTERDGTVQAALVAPPSPPAPAPPAPPAAVEPADSGRHAEPSSSPYHRPVADRQPYPRRHVGRPLRAVGESRPAPDDAAGRLAGTAPNGLVTLPADTSRVVARLAQLLREDPSLAAGWARDR